MKITVILIIAKNNMIQFVVVTIICSMVYDIDLIYTHKNVFITQYLRKGEAVE